MRDWLSLLHFDSLRQCVYLYDVSNRAVHHPQVHEVEWPVVWVLARYHKKSFGRLNFLQRRG